MTKVKAKVKTSPPTVLHGTPLSLPSGFSPGVMGSEQCGHSVLQPWGQGSSHSHPPQGPELADLAGERLLDMGPSATFRVPGVKPLEASRWKHHGQKGIPCTRPAQAESCLHNLL